MTTPISVITARTVPLSSLWLEAPNWTNPRLFSGLDDSDIDELGASIKAKGINDPLKVQRIKVNGDVIDLVIDGQRRALAARGVLPKNAPIPVVDIEEEACDLTPEKADELLLKALTTLEREDLSSYELSNVAERMKARNKTGEYIAAAIGKSASWVSKFLKALSTASPKLMHQWRKGQVTDEQFKELAEVKGEDKQAEAAKEVVEARKSGDKSEARNRAKEIKETARAASKPDKTATVRNGHNTTLVVKPTVSGPQLPLLKEAKEPEVKKAEPKPPSKHALADFIGMADKRPPVADYVKGLMDGVKWAMGFMQPDQWAKSWHQYLARIEGRPRPAKKVKAKRVARPVKKAKARKKLSSTGKRKR